MIKIKEGKVLELLLKSPSDLCTLIEIFKESGKSNDFVNKSYFNPFAIDNLVKLGLLIEVGNEVRVDGNKFFSIPKTREKSWKDLLLVDLFSKKELDRVKSGLSPDEATYLQVTVSFAYTFKSNLSKLGSATTNIDKATVSKWYQAIQNIIVKDNVTIDQLRSVQKFLKDHDFWSYNVQSTMKLREKFQTIHAQMLSDGRVKKNTTTRQAKTTRSERKDY